MAESLLRRTSLGVLLASILAFSAIAQSGDVFKVRLSPVSMDTAMKINIEGSGSATASLDGNTVSISGKFQGLLSPATTAQLHMGSFTGVRGPVLFNVKISQAVAGTVEGTFRLSADQIDALRKGRFYLEIASEKAPDGNLWGWLLK